MKKIGLICMALVLALGLGGVAYAGWTDTVTIDGTVNTGDVNVDILGYSETHVYKDLSGDACVVVYTAMNLSHTVLYHSINGGAITAGAPTIEGDWLLIASAEVTSISQPGNTITVVYDNLFPCIDFATDLLVQYNGSIPVKVQSDVFASTDAWLVALEASGNIDSGAVRVDITTTPPTPDLTSAGIVDIGTQLDEGDCVLLVMVVHIPQDDPTLMGQSGSATYTLTAIQWNEY